MNNRMIKEFYILIAPVFWSTKNNLIKFNWNFYKKMLFYICLSGLFIFLTTKLLDMGMLKLQTLSPDVFNSLMIKGYSIIFLIIFIVQIINSFVITLNTYYQTKELETLFISPISRTAVFFSKFFETHLKTSWMLVVFGFPLLISAGLIFKANVFYYLYSLIIFIMFSTIPVNIGIAAAMFAAGVFSIKKMKKFIVTFLIITIAAAVTIVRLIKPERFINPELFATLALFINEIQTPSFILLPNRWVSEAIFNFLNKNYSEIFVFAALIFLTSYITGLVSFMVYQKRHFAGWISLQEGDITSKTKKTLSEKTGTVSKLAENKFIKKLISGFNVTSRALFKKEFLYQIRDTKTINQMFILSLLIIVYLFSIVSLPLNWEDYIYWLKYSISFFNLGLILIIITAVCSRLMYPAIVAEKSTLWIIKTAPITPKRYVWTKFIYFLIPLLLFGELLAVLSFIFIRVEFGFFILNVFAIGLAITSLASMALAFSFHDLKDEAKESAKTGSMAYMISSVILVLAILTIEILPTFLYFLKVSRKTAFSQKAFLIFGAAIFALIVINFLAAFVSIRYSIKKIEHIELAG